MPLMEEQKVYQELLEKLDDRYWRLNNLYWIKDKQGMVVQFKMNWAQEELYKNMHTRNVILKARQLGFTTFIDIFILDACLFNSAMQGGVIADNKDNAEEIFKNKVQFAYNRLPEELRARRGLMEDSKSKISLTNSSAIRVGTSMRSGTMQILHISELGKISAKYPEKAKEIISGSIEAVPLDGLVFVESTAEGKGGVFYNMCDQAQKLHDSNAKLTNLDYKFHFFPWWRNPEYSMDENYDNISEEDNAYFDDIEVKVGERIHVGQRNWYIKKREGLKLASSQMTDEDMKKEYPSTPEEAFESAIEGAVFKKEFATLRKQDRIKTVPYDPNLPVNTFWDLGWGDYTTIWFHQYFQGEHRFIDYYENHHENTTHYVRYLQSKGYVYGKHYLPHDAESKHQATGQSTGDICRSLGFPIEVVKAQDLISGINATRNKLPTAIFDKTKCGKGLEHLEGYRYEWDDKLAIYKREPLHDEHSHASDAIRQWAIGWKEIVVSAGFKQGPQVRRHPLTGQIMR